jgi:hypothetical protein
MRAVWNVPREGRDMFYSKYAEDWSNNALINVIEVAPYKNNGVFRLFFDFDVKFQLRDGALPSAVDIDLGVIVEDVQEELRACFEDGADVTCVVVFAEPREVKEGVGKLAFHLYCPNLYVTQSTLLGLTYKLQGAMREKYGEETFPGFDGYTILEKWVDIVDTGPAKHPTCRLPGSVKYSKCRCKQQKIQCRHPKSMICDKKAVYDKVLVYDSSSCYDDDAMQEYLRNKVKLLTDVSLAFPESDEITGLRDQRSLVALAQRAGSLERMQSESSEHDGTALGPQRREAFLQCMRRYFPRYKPYNPTYTKRPRAWRALLENGMCVNKGEAHKSYQSYLRMDPTGLVSLVCFDSSEEQLTIGCCPDTHFSMQVEPGEILAIWGRIPRKQSARGKDVSTDVNTGEGADPSFLVKLCEIWDKAEERWWRPGAKRRRLEREAADDEDAEEQEREEHEHMWG